MRAAVDDHGGDEMTRDDEQLWPLSAKHPTVAATTISLSKDVLHEISDTDTRVHLTAAEQPTLVAPFEVVASVTPLMRQGVFVPPAHLQASSHSCQCCCCASKTHSCAMDQRDALTLDVNRIATNST